jgi:hypothetical protein
MVLQKICNNLSKFCKNSSPTGESNFLITVIFEMIIQDPIENGWI